GDDEDLHGHGKSLAIGAWQEALADDAAKGFADHGGDLVLLVGGKDVEDAADGACSAAGVKGSEHEVAGLCGGYGDGDGFEVAQLADDDDVGILAEGGAQGGGE